jgi:hypothetical protein
MAVKALPITFAYARFWLATCSRADALVISPLGDARAASAGKFCVGRLQAFIGTKRHWAVPEGTAQ